MVPPRSSKRLRPRRDMPLKPVARMIQSPGNGAPEWRTSMATMGLALPRSRGIAEAAGRWMRRLVTQFQRELKSRREITWLMEQDDRMLGDLGVCRHEIARIVRYGR